MVFDLYYSDEQRRKIILTSSRISLTERYIREATNEKYGVVDLYEERLPGPPDSEPSSPTFSDESD